MDLQQLGRANTKRCFNAGEQPGFRQIVAFAIADLLYVVFVWS